MINLGFTLLILGTIKFGIKPIDQTVYYQSACESVACVEVMDYYGVDISVDEFLEKLPTINEYYDGVYNDYFLGDPKSNNGFICYENPLISVIDGYCNSRSLQGEEADTILSLVGRGYPVVVWITYNFNEPIYKSNYDYIWNSHTVVINGYDSNTGEIYIADSIYGEVTTSYERFEYVYDKCGRHALLIYE